MAAPVVHDRPVFIGLDLAWSNRNRTGGAVIQDGRLVAATGVLDSDAAILRFVAAHLPANAAAVMAVDAPLCVPNASGKRRCEKELAREWQRYDAAPHSANQRIMASYGGVRGKGLVDQLAELYQFGQVLPLPRQGQGRYICEVYPHPAHVALFQLEKIFQYKRRSPKKRSRETSIAGFTNYQTHMKDLAYYDPPLIGLDHLTSASVSDLHGQAWKLLEDQLDAVSCAYIAWYAWWHGPTRQLVYGSVDDGHILTLRHTRA